MAIGTKTLKSWGLTWERRKDGKPVLDSKGTPRRTGNRFFSQKQAQEVYDRTLAAGKNPSPIKEEVGEWLYM